MSRGLRIPCAIGPCRNCGKAIPEDKNSSAIYCSKRCVDQARHARTKKKAPVSPN